MDPRLLLAHFGIPGNVDRAAFERSLASTARASTLFGAALILSVFPLWGLLDPVLEPGSASSLLRMRAVFLVPIALVVAWLWRTDPASPRFHALTCVMTALPGAAVAYMIAIVAHYEAYTIGYSLMLWGAGTLLVLPLRWVAVLMLGLLAMVAAALVVHPRPLAELAVIAAYLLSAAAISFVTSVVVHGLRYRQFLAIAALEREREHVASLMQRLERLSHEDDLTGLANRRRWRGMLEDAQEWQRVLAVAILDVDHFKRINDSHGHESGDRVLAEVARALSQELAGEHLVARLGGDELGVLSPDVALAARMERVRAQVAALAWGSDGLVVTLSIGVALRCGQEEPRSLLIRADRALYRAKLTRNAVCVDPDA